MRRHRLLALGIPLIALAWLLAGCAKSTEPRAHNDCVERCRAIAAQCEGQTQGSGNCEAAFDSCRAVCDRLH